MPHSTGVAALLQSSGRSRARAPSDRSEACTYFIIHQFTVSSPTVTQPPPHPDSFLSRAGPDKHTPNKKKLKHKPPHAFDLRFFFSSSSFLPLPPPPTSIATPLHSPTVSLSPTSLFPPPFPQNSCTTIRRDPPISHDKLAPRTARTARWPGTMGTC